MRRLTLTEAAEAWRGAHMLRSTASVILIVAIFSASPALSQAESAWFVGGEAGWYEVHESFGGEAPDGVAIALLAGRRWGAVGVQLAVSQALGDDEFTSFEPGLLLLLPPSTPVYGLGGVGGGLMWEHSGTLSLPYYVQFGLGVRLGSRTDLRATVRRGSHANTGDSGTFRGPHMITVGVIRLL